MIEELNHPIITKSTMSKTTLLFRATETFLSKQQKDVSL